MPLGHLCSIRVRKIDIKTSNILSGWAGLMRIYRIYIKQENKFFLSFVVHDTINLGL